MLIKVICAADLLFLVKIPLYVESSEFEAFCAQISTTLTLK